MAELARTLTYDEVQVGAELPPLAIPLTATRIIATAIASRDYQDVHHDVELAKQRGAKGIFMNILSTNGLVGRYVSDWAGPEAIFKKVLEAREDKPLTKLRTTITNQDGTVVLDGSALVWSEQI